MSPADGESGLEAFRAQIDRVAALYSEGEHQGEIERARREFDELRGVVYSDEALYEAHVAAFLEWYVLERPLAGGDPPVLRRLRDPGAEEERAWLRPLALSLRSLFEVLDPSLRRPSGLRLLDLLGGGTWRVDRPEPMDGLAEGDIFEARLIPWEGRVRFGPVFCFHPRPARRCIRDLVRLAERDGRLGPALILSLARMRLKHARFRNIPVERIYSGISSEK